jgi:hypothetical protein
MTFAVASAKAIIIKADSNMTLETNSPSAPSNTISLKAGIAYKWGISEGYAPLLFTVNVTAWYITNTAAGRLVARILT